MTSHIRKRDGRIVGFNPDNIRKAVYGAALDAGKDKSHARHISEGIAAEAVAKIRARFRKHMPSAEDAQDIVEHVLLERKYTDIAKSYMFHRQRLKEMREVKTLFGVKDDLNMGLNAMKVLKERYLKKDENGDVTETPSQMFRRVAKAIASVERKYGKSEKYVKELEDKFYNLMVNREFLPNSPTLMNAGTEISQLSACFVLPVEDSMESIFEAVKNMAIIQKSGGGTGFNFSHLRPEGDIVQSTRGVASGPVSFLRVFDTATEVTKQGGRRRGANMGILRYDHPDITRFITAKAREGMFTNFNLSVSVEDRFMDAVLGGKKYDLINPRTGKVAGKLNAKDVFDLIVANAWQHGDPGLIFLDTINRKNPTPDVGKIETTNPCLTKDCWVLTENGPEQISNLLNHNKKIICNGSFYQSRGFFPTGKKNILKIITKEGYEIKATPNHLLLVSGKLTRYVNEKIWKPAADIKKGDRLVIGNNRTAKWDGKGSFDEGYLLGLLFGDGCIPRNENSAIIDVWETDKGSHTLISEAEKVAHELEHRSDFKGFSTVNKNGKRRLKLRALRKLALKFGITPEKEIRPMLERTSFDFHCGFLRGLFDTDGSVQGNQQKGISVRLWQCKRENLQTIQRMLQRIGILSSIHFRKGIETKLMPNGHGGKKYYTTKEGYEIIIANENISFFAEKIGFVHSEKKRKLFEALKSYKRKFNRERFIAIVDKVERLVAEEVFDVMVPGTNMLDSNGFIVHNCGELPLLPYESCNLGSINLSRIIKEKEGKKDIDWDKLKEIVKTVVRFLDNVIDANKYPLKQIEKMTKANRKIGLGIMGFAEALIQLGIPYDSERGVKLGEKIMKFITENARKESGNLGKEKGSFPNKPKSIYRKYRHMRNATVTSIAPTGTISIIAGCSSGIEPLFAVNFVRNVLKGAKLIEVNHYFEKAAKEGGFYSKELMMQVSRAGSIQHLKNIPASVRKVFRTALDIQPEWHVKMQAAVQRYTDNSVSKTINLPQTAVPEDVRKSFLLAWKLGCKGITVYRYGSKKEQVLNIGMEEHVSADPEYSGGCPKKPYCEA